MVLGKLPVPGRPAILITVGQGPIALAVGAGGGGLDIFTLIYPFSPLSPSLWETARYRLKYCLKGPLNPKQPTNQPMIIIRYTTLFDFICVFFFAHTVAITVIPHYILSLILCVFLSFFFLSFLYFVLSFFSVNNISLKFRIQYNDCLNLKFGVCCWS